MSEILADIIDAAHSAWPSTREEAVAIHATIARAILAERQRCADVARKYRERDPAEDGSGYWAADEIAAAILA